LGKVVRARVRDCVMVGAYFIQVVRGTWAEREDHTEGRC
jgi:hypothetical protein